MPTETRNEFAWLSGAFTAIITPFSEDSTKVDWQLLRKQLHFQYEPRHNIKGVNGIVALGTTGESPTITGSEADKIASTCLEIREKTHLKIILGTGSNNTANAAHRQKWAESLGADATLSVVPYYNKPTQEGIYRHFMTIADAADIPVILYNIPGRCGTGMSIETISRLATHENIVAVKHATGSVDEAARLHEACPDLILLSGDDPLTLPLAFAGVTGCISVLSNILPAEIRELIEVANKKDWLKAEKLNLQLIQLARGLMSITTNPIGIKTAMKILGYDSGTLRLPMLTADEKLQLSIRALLKQSGFFTQM